MQTCPYCHGSKVIKKGLRVKKLEKVQLFYCQHCQRKFTPGASKHKTFPLKIILDSLTLYNRFSTLEVAAEKISEKYGLRVSPQNISNWLSDFADYLPFLRMRSFLAKRFSKNIILSPPHLRLSYYNSASKKQSPQNHKSEKKLVRSNLIATSPKKEQTHQEPAITNLQPAAWSYTLNRDQVSGSGLERGEAAFVESQLFHGQIYDFKYHRAKCELILQEEFRHYRFRPLQEFLELVIAECPHSIFKESQLRASEFRDIFNLNQVKITPKQNMASRSARLVMQTVANNKLRHQALQEFMLINDSVTVACEVPVLLDAEDLLHYKNDLGFHIPKELNDQFSITNNQSIINNQPHNNQLDHLNIDHSLGVERLKIENSPVITGHIDFLQIRNGSIHIMDFKPSAKKQKPVDQLTLYALALSRLTGLRLFHFKCAWFDEEDYFEFFPLHVVYKKKQPRKARPFVRKAGGAAGRVPAARTLPI